jgi:hypothetical protein
VYRRASRNVLNVLNNQVSVRSHLLVLPRSR